MGSTSHSGCKCDLSYFFSAKQHTSPRLRGSTSHSGCKCDANYRVLDKYRRNPNFSLGNGEVELEKVPIQDRFSVDIMQQVAKEETLAPGKPKNLCRPVEFMSQKQFSVCPVDPACKRGDATWNTSLWFKRKSWDFCTDDSLAYVEESGLAGAGGPNNTFEVPEGVNAIHGVRKPVGGGGEGGGMGLAPIVMGGEGGGKDDTVSIQKQIIVPQAGGGETVGGGVGAGGLVPPGGNGASAAAAAQAPPPPAPAPATPPAEKPAEQPPGPPMPGGGGNVPGLPALVAELQKLVYVMGTQSASAHQRDIEDMRFHQKSLTQLTKHNAQMEGQMAGAKKASIMEKMGGPAAMAGAAGLALGAAGLAGLGAAA